MNRPNTTNAHPTLAAARPTSRWQPPALVISDGAIEALKWIALILMTGDHVNKYLLKDAYPILFNLGRIAAPLFCFVLAFNLARPNTLERGVYVRTITRLIAFAAIASIPYIGLGSMKIGYIFFGWWPLNILATLAVATCCILFLDRAKTIDGLLFAITLVVGGLVGEFWWPAITLCIGVWLYCRRPGWSGLILSVFSAAAFFFINRNHWALGALPLVFAAQFIRPKIGRTKLFFYLFYPGHLAIIWALVWTKTI